MQMAAFLSLLSWSLFPDFDSRGPVFRPVGETTVTPVFFLELAVFDAFVAGNQRRRAGLRSKVQVEIQFWWNN